MDAKWGHSYTKGWVFGYKQLHLACEQVIDELVSLLTADVTTANIQDN